MPKRRRSTPYVDVPSALMRARPAREFGGVAHRVPFGRAHAAVRDLLRAGGLEARTASVSRRISVDDVIESLGEPAIGELRMTSFAFILGVVPMLTSSGAGAEMRFALGIAVFSGMLGVTIFGLVFTPVFYEAIRRRVAGGAAVSPAPAPAAEVAHGEGPAVRRAAP